MPRDPRLYMTFPIDFDEHPKVEPLSDAAFRTFVAMNGYSRRQKLDGRIPAVVARKRWRVRALTELVNSDPDRPLVLVDGDAYVLRDYAEHQFTTADEAELYERKARAGAAGGRAKAAAVAGAKQPPQQDVAGSGSGSEIDQTDVTHLDPVRSEATVRDAPTDAEMIAEEAGRLGIRNLDRVHRSLEGAVGAISSKAAAVDLARAVLALASAPVRSVDAYLSKACTNSPLQVREEWRRLQQSLGPVAA